jgi:hypothetical protein
VLGNLHSVDLASLALNLCLGFHKLQGFAFGWEHQYSRMDYTDLEAIGLGTSWRVLVLGTSWRVLVLGTGLRVLVLGIVGLLECLSVDSVDAYTLGLNLASFQQVQQSNSYALDGKH